MSLAAATAGPSGTSHRRQGTGSTVSGRFHGDVSAWRSPPSSPLRNRLFLTPFCLPQVALGVLSFSVPRPPSTVQPAAHAEQNNWPQRSGHQGTRFLPGRPALEELRWWQHPWPLPERPDRGGRAGPADTVTSPLWPFLLALLLVLKRNDVFTRWGWGAQLDKRGTREWRLREMCASICGHSQPHAREDRR